MKKIDRRAFLKISLSVAAGLAGCASSNTEVTSTGLPATPISSSPLPSLFPGEMDPSDLTRLGEMPPTEIPNPMRFFGVEPPSLAQIVANPKVLKETFDHVVVLQLENRAFDHIVGFLYPSGKSPLGQPFNGVGNQFFDNPVPGGGTVGVYKTSDLQTPIIDPAEQYTALNVALFNEFNPPSNVNAKEEKDFVAPFNIPNGGAYFPPPMSGFINAFQWRLRSYKKPVDGNTFPTIMGCFSPSAVPVLNQLAANFAVCDNWHCGVPSQTYCNRSFFHAASSSGFLVNSPFTNWVFHNTAKTIFDSLTENKRSWMVAYDADDVVVATRFINHPTMKKYSRFSDHFNDMHHFYDIVERGELPDYTFVQPRFVIDTNSYHPDKGAPAIRRGEVLVNDVYQAIRNSSNAKGSNYLNTLLIITFDEGGTCFDHVPPPGAKPPDDGYTGEYGFQFDRLGQRIPTILVSPWLQAGTVLNNPFDATSVMKTMEDKWGLSPINKRDAASVSLGSIPCLSQARPRSDMPVLRVRKLATDDNARDPNEPLGEMGEGVVGLVNALAGGTDATAENIQTAGAAIEFLKQRAAVDP